MNVGMVTKKMFFDNKKILAAVDRATRKVLSRFGAFVRTRAQTSIRKRKAVSAPGQPPSSHAGHLRRLIYFGYDVDRHSVVIGPQPFRGPAEAPPLLEYGGTARRVDRKTKRIRTMTYRPRPFMGPAFEREEKDLPALWADSVQ